MERHDGHLPLQVLGISTFLFKVRRCTPSSPWGGMAIILLSRAGMMVTSFTSGRRGAIPLDLKYIVCTLNVYYTYMYIYIYIYTYMYIYIYICICICACSLIDEAVLICIGVSAGTCTNIHMHRCMHPLNSHWQYPLIVNISMDAHVCGSIGGNALRYQCKSLI